MIKPFAAAVLAVGLLLTPLAGVQPANAKINIIIQIGPGSDFEPAPGRYSCRAVADSLYGNGFRNIRVLDCRGRSYVYAATRDGRRWTVWASSRTRRILEIQRRF